MAFAFRPLVRRTSLLVTLLVAVAGCGSSERKASEALSKQSVATTTEFASYQADVASAYEHVVSTRVYLSTVPYTQADRTETAEMLTALRDRADLADSLKALATKAAGVLDFSPDDAKAAARSVVSEIEKVDHHTLAWPKVSGLALPLPDPNETLDKAVSALVAFEAERDYRKGLPYLMEAIRWVDRYFEAERLVYTAYQVEDLQNDYAVVTDALNNETVIDVSFLQPAFDPFGIAYKPSSVPNTPATEPFRKGLRAALGERLHPLVSAAVARGARVSSDLFALERQVATTLKAKPLPPFLSPDDLPADAASRLAAEIAAKLPPKEGAAPPRPGGLRDSLVARLAAQASPAQAATLAKGSGAAQRAVLADLLNVALGGPAFVRLPSGVYDTGDVPGKTDLPKPYADAIVMLGYVGMSRPLATGAASTEYYVALPPAGRRIAELNRAVIDDLFGLPAPK